jgi:hypothetical protein
MNITDAVALVAYRLGNRTDLNARILSEMGNVQEFVLEKAPILPWFLLSEDTSVDTTISEERIAIPSDFLREFEGSTLWYPQPTEEVPWRALKKEDYDDLRVSMGVTISKTGSPTHYALSGAYFRLAPEPDAVYSIQMRYYQQDTNVRTLTTTQTNLWLTHQADLVVAETCVVLGRQLRYRKDAQEQYELDRGEAQKRFWIDVEARKHANRRYEMGM